MPKGYARRVVAPPPRPGAPGHAPAGQRPADPVITFDDPQDEEWFQRLPSAAQEEYRARWKAGEERGLSRERLAKDTLKRSVAQGAGVFFFTETCCTIPSVWHSLAGLAVGAALGVLWNRIGAGRFRCLTTSVAPYAVLRVAFVGDRQGPALAAWCIVAVLGFVMLAGLATAVGFVRERRRADDLDH